MYYNTSGGSYCLVVPLFLMLRLTSTRTINNQGHSLQISHFAYVNLLTVSQKEKESSNQKYDANTKVWRLAVSENCRSLALKDAQAGGSFILVVIRSARPQCGGRCRE